MVALTVSLSAGCALHRTHEESERFRLVAVLPLDVEVPAARRTAAGEAHEPIPVRAGLVVTAQIYGQLAARPRFRFVPDLTVDRVMSRSEMRDATTRQARAVLLGTLVHADAVLFGFVSQFHERVGGTYGASEPAAVAFVLKLLDVSTGKVVWSGSFVERQRPLTSNLLRFWSFWKGGGRWMTAAELARVGVGRLLDELSEQLGS